MNKPIVRITLTEAEYIIDRVVGDLLPEYTEPIPPANERTPGILESCINAPFQAISGQDLYPTLESKAAFLFYLLIKNHPLKNGNKRSAIVLLITFLIKNGYWFMIEPDQLYAISIRVAESRMEEKEEILAVVRKLIKNGLVDQNDIK